MLRFKRRSSSEGESKFDMAFLKAWEKMLARSDLVLLPNCLFLYQVKAERFSVQRQEHFTPEQSGEKKEKRRKETRAGVRCSRCCGRPAKIKANSLSPDVA